MQLSPACGAWTSGETDAGGMQLSPACGVWTSGEADAGGMQLSPACCAWTSGEADAWRPCSMHVSPTCIEGIVEAGDMQLSLHAVLGPVGKRTPGTVIRQARSQGPAQKPV